MKHLFYTLLLLVGLSAHSKDLDMFRLVGPVDSLCVEMNDAGLTWQCEYSFDDDGFLIEVDGVDINVERDRNGFITDFIIEEDDEDNEPITIETKITYDKAGRVTGTKTVSPDEEWTETFTYNHEGLLIKREYMSADSTEDFYYTYTKFDPLGNWTERQEKVSSLNQSIIQTRHITYRGDKHPLSTQ